MVRTAILGALLVVIALTVWLLLPGDTALSGPAAQTVVTTTTVHPTAHSTPATVRSVRSTTTTTTAPARTAPVVPSTTSTAPAPQPPYPVQTQTVHFVDPTRDTAARGDVSAVSGRILDTEIFKPVGAKSPLPLVVFAHGWDNDPDGYATLLNAWAAAGYLVAAPIFPDSSDTLPGDPTSDIANQAKDLSFVINQMLGGTGGPVDPHRIAIAGHSDGGTDVAVLALNPAYNNPKVRAYLSFSSQIPDSIIDGPWGTKTSGSLLVIGGTDDDYGLYPDTEQVFETADMAKVMLTVDGGDHLQMYIDGSQEASALRADTVTFLNTALGPTDPTSAQLGAALQNLGDSSISMTTG
jgi:dienelactone hydrolase